MKASLSLDQVMVKVELRPTVSRPVCLGVSRPSGIGDQYFFLLKFIFRLLRVCWCGEPSLTRGQVWVPRDSWPNFLSQFWDSCIYFPHEQGSQRWNFFYITYKNVGRPLRREVRSVVFSCCYASPAKSFQGLCPTGLLTLFYCLDFETPVFISPTNRVVKDGISSI
jgi:hypothetical protein